MPFDVGLDFEVRPLEFAGRDAPAAVQAFAPDRLIGFDRAIRGVHPAGHRPPPRKPEAPTAPRR